MPELSHDVAMHIAAAKPKALDETGVDQAQIEAERRIAIEKAREAGKPEAMLERIAEGTVKKFLKEVTLVNQPFVKDDKKSVGELVKAAGAQIGGYTLFVVGEGIESALTTSLLKSPPRLPPPRPNLTRARISPSG